MGTGFSFTQDSRGYAVNEDDVAKDLYRYNAFSLRSLQAKYFTFSTGQFIITDHFFKMFEIAFLIIYFTGQSF